jgi:cytochrome d ubiquinol oxidase subunit I
MGTWEAASPSVPAAAIATSLGLFTLVYLMLFALFLFLLDQKIRHGLLPEDLGTGRRRA